jgi:hypothetical protein
LNDHLNLPNAFSSSSPIVAIATRKSIKPFQASLVLFLFSFWLLLVIIKSSPHSYYQASGEIERVEKDDIAT